ncbi:MAG: mechanosensitive ion channel family protein [Lysobacteraceae bacterium]|nr:MAG: mechanosensitive ion channel family protein [Xanthomonadaceae bacterium]
MLLTLTKPASASSASHLADRFAQALDQVQAKLVQLVASAPLLLVAVLIVLLSLSLGGFLSRRMRVVTRLSRSNPYMDGLLRNIVKTLVVLAGVLVALDLLGATSLVGAVLGSAGVIGLVLGFAFKDIAENYVAGILLSLRQPFSPGDSVRIDNHEGKVVALTSRATVLMTADGSHLQLPNGLVFKSVLLNFSRNPKRRFEFETTVEARASWHQAMDLGIASIASLDGVLAAPAPSALIRNLSNDGATLQFHGWIDQTRNDLQKTRSEAMRRVRKALRQAGIVPPETVQKVILVRSEGDDQHAHESDVERDTSVDHTLDAQVGHARHQEDGSDLLNAPPPPPQSP